MLCIHIEKYGKGEIMQKLEKDFQAIYNSVTGGLKKEYRVPWVGNAWKDQTAYRQAYADFWTAREHLCQRFGMDWEDEDLERFMNGILDLEEDLCRRMFYCTIYYVQNDMKL